tara:strand:+ start:153 stop:482 length:330 start_codon:yes stop_codon:yes gene_type:complete
MKQTFRPPSIGFREFFFILESAIFEIFDPATADLFGDFYDLAEAGGIASELVDLESEYDSIMHLAAMSKHWDELPLLPANSSDARFELAPTIFASDFDFEHLVDFDHLE